MFPGGNGIPATNQGEPACPQRRWAGYPAIGRHTQAVVRRWGRSRPTGYGSYQNGALRLAPYRVADAECLPALDAVQIAQQLEKGLADRLVVQRGPRGVWGRQLLQQPRFGRQQQPTAVD